MNTKLALNVDKAVIEKAKEYASSHKISLSKLAESYLSSLITEQSKGVEITLLVKSLKPVRILLSSET